MSILEAIFLGAVQGLTEFIPVSSSGHMLIASSLFDIPSSFELETLLNVGTLLAAIIYFHRDVFSVVRNVTSGKDNSLLIRIALATLPLLVAGVMFDIFLADILRGDVITVVMLVAVGSLMLYIKPGGKSFERINIPDAVYVGLSQILALIPGTSRSGITILAGMKRNFDAVAAARFSFLLSIPAVGAAVVYTWFSLASDGTAIGQSVGALIAGNVAAFTTALIAIHGMITFLKKFGLRAFGWYRIGLGVILLVVMITN